MTAPERLATYGTLRPGQPNHHQMAGIAGVWSEGWVRGRLVPEGWGAALGYPALAPDPAGPRVAVALFTSADLSAHWPRLDAFEGEGYQRVRIAVATAEGACEAWIYAAVGTPPP